MARFASALALVVATALAYPTDEERQTVSEWDALMVQYGFDYAMYKVTTLDDWELTLFRITGKAGQAANASTKPPVLLQHAGTQDAASWLAAYSGADPMPLQLVTAGYDVWMSNSRASRYSNVNSRYPNAENPMNTHEFPTDNFAKYDFGFVEMARGDIPAVLDQVKAVTEQEKVTFIGYSNATTQLLYAAAKDQRYLSETLNKAILMAPCLYTTTSGLENYKQVFPAMREHSVNSIPAFNYSYQLEDICDATSGDYNEATCSFMTGFNTEGIQQVSTKMLEHIDQIAIRDAFVEYDPNFATDQETAPLVTPGLDSITKVPMQFMVAANDTVCPAKQAMRLYEEIPSVTSYKVIPDYNQDVFGWNNQPAFMTELISQIEFDPNAPIPVDPKDPSQISGASSLFGLGLTSTVLAAVLALN